MATFKRFEDLPVWNSAIGLAVSIFRLTSRDSFRFKGDLVNQCRRAALSVSNNIAEGLERGTTSELISFLYIARGSVAEVRSMLRFSIELGDMSRESSDIHRIIDDCESISRQIRAWLESLQDSDIKGQRHLNRGRRDEYERRSGQAAFEAQLASLLAFRERHEQEAVAGAAEGDAGKMTDMKAASDAAAETGNDGAQDPPQCPLCGKPMARRRSRDGKEFWGCSAYPACRGSRSMRWDCRRVCSGTEI